MRVWPALTALATALIMPALAQAPAAVTPAQMEAVHSRLFGNDAVGIIPSMLASITGDVHVRCILPVVQRVSFSEPELALFNLVCQPDIVVLLAKAEAPIASHLYADGGYIYTDWHFKVEEVLRDDSAAPMGAGTSVVVTRPGGKLKIDQRLVDTVCPGFPDFESGKEYVLFVRFVPQTGAYALSGPYGFTFEGSKTIALDQLENWQFAEAVMNRDLLLQSIRKANAAKDCVHRRPNPTPN